MNDFFLEMALRHFGFDEQQIARIRAFIPKAAYLTRLIKLHKTLINEAIDIAEMVANQIKKEI